MKSGFNGTPGRTPVNLRVNVVYFAIDTHLPLTQSGQSTLREGVSKLYHFSHPRGVSKVYHFSHLSFARSGW